ENEWKGPRFNRKFGPGAAEIIVTAENAKPLHISITIKKDQDKSHRIIRIENFQSKNMSEEKN
ncbi:MAG: hypothetical protein ACR2IS_00240, partial [Nitrososphaeraceae archaeon]